MAAVLRQALRADVPAIQRVRHAVTENRLTSGIITDDEVVAAPREAGAVAAGVALKPLPRPTTIEPRSPGPGDADAR